MYKAINGGSATGQSGRLYRFTAGKNVQGNPDKGELEHCKSVIWVDKKEDPKENNDFENLPEDVEFPYHYGGGNYFLSNGEQVRGKDNANQAQQELDES